MLASKQAIVALVGGHRGSLALVGAAVAAAGAVAGLAALGVVPAGLAGAIPSRAAARASRDAPAALAPGTAEVAYAGSLLKLNEGTVGPAFTKATGIPYQGQGAGALGLAQEIRSGEITPNVFESIGAGPIAVDEPRFTDWYLSVAASPIVVAYNPRSRFAPELRAIARHDRPIGDLFRLMEQKGFLLGRTNPATDPQGQAFALMVHLAAATYHLGPGAAARILGPLTTSSEIFSETALEPRLQAGQLDAASAFLSQAVQLHLAYVALPATIDFGYPKLATTYARAHATLPGVGRVHGVPLVVDLTTIGTTDPQAAAQFIAFQLNPGIRGAFEQGGYTLLKPTLHGDLAAVPAVVREAVASG